LHKFNFSRILIQEGVLAENDELEGPKPGSWAWVAVAWLLVGVPLLWGIWTTLKKAIVLFR
jgi:hypothetical protein